MQTLTRILMLACALMAFVTGQAIAQEEIVQDEVIVGVKPASDRPILKAQLAWMAGADVEHNPALHVHRIKLKPGLSLDAAIAGLLKRPEVAYAEPNHIYHTNATPNDASYAAKQYAPQIVQAEAAWAIWNPQGTAVIAIIDTGIDYTHPDLINKILRDTNGNVIGTNTVGSNLHSNNPADPADDHGHGTHCAGIAAGQIDNATGIAGIAGWNGAPGSTDVSHVKLMPIKVLTSIGSGTDTTVANGITWAADHGANVISMSLGGGGSTTLSNAVAYAWNKGCVIVAAAGNSHTSSKDYPAGYPNVISVAATDKTDTLTYYSNYGTWVTCCAPGGGNTAADSIYSTLPIYANSFGLNYGGLSGTSMACPLVSGEAALIISQVPTLSNSQVKNFITGNVDAYIPYLGRTIATGAGRVNVFKALAAASGGVGSVPAAPTSLTAAAGDTTATLNWSASAGATGYNVKRSVVSGSGYVQIATNVSTTTYSDSGLANGTTYYYVVTATNAAGESGNSNQASATPQAGTLNQLLVNPGFEIGATPWIYSAGIITNAAVSEVPHAGSWYVCMGGKGVKHQDDLEQQVTIPATITKATLTFWYHIDSQDIATTAVDLLQVQLRNTSGLLVKQLATLSNLNKTAGYVQKTYDLTAYKGQTIRIHCQGSENAGGTTTFTLDDFSLTVQ